MAKKHVDAPKGGLPGWMGTYGDLVTLLLCFFILLFAMSNVDATKYKAVAESFGKRFDVMPGGEAISGGELIINSDGQLSGLDANGTGEDPSAEESSNPVIQQSTDSEPVISNPSEAVDSKAIKMAEEVKAYLEQKGIDDQVLLSYTSNYVKMTLPGEVLFDSGEANIKSEGEKLLVVIKDMIVEKEYIKYFIQIEGHTDDRPINTAQYPSNWYLSSDRAVSVGEWLISKFNFDPKMLACVGYGEYDPIVSNETVEGRAKNRRVEIKILLD